MKTIYKRTFWVLPGLLFVLGWSGCKKDWLDRLPQGRYTEDDIPAGSLEGQVYAAYAGLRKDGLSGLPYIAVHNIRSDDADKGSSVSDGVDAENFFDNFQYVTDFWLLNTYWTDHYNLILLANNVIAAADSLEADSATSVNVAEARFLRAYAYFDLVRAFGEVPKIDFRVVDPADVYVPKSPVEEIFAFIDADLEEAAALLPLDWPGYPGRITRGAAMALQAKTFLFRSQWGAALAAAEGVIHSGMYDLSVPYDEIFTEDRENSSESVFEIQAVYTQGQTEFGITYASRQGVRGAGDWNLGWGWNTPNELLAQAFEPGDPRKDATLLYAGQVNPPYGESVPPATTNVPRPYWNKKVYTDPAIRAATGSQAGQWFNMRVIRYADVVLMAAEAANETGNAAKALEYLEMIRGRARGDDASILPEVTTTDYEDLRDAIRHERRVELGMENERFFDLVRWGTVLPVMHAAGKTGYQPRHRYLPIPQPEIDRSGGILEQNPDY